MCLKKLRNERNMTQAELADLMGISKTAYWRIENNPEKAALARFIKLAKIYNIDLATLLDPKPGSSPKV